MGLITLSRHYPPFQIIRGAEYSRPEKQLRAAKPQISVLHPAGLDNANTRSWTYPLQQAVSDTYCFLLFKGPLSLETRSKTAARIISLKDWPASQVTVIEWS